MSAKQRKDGRWEIQGSERGQRFHKLLPEGAKKADAIAYERKIRSDIFNAKELGHVPDYTIGEAIMRYKREYKGKSFPTNHAKALAPFVIGKALSEIRTVAAEVRKARGISNSTANRRLAILRRVAHLAYKRWNWLREPLHEKIEMLPENPARNVFLTRSELAKLLRGISDRGMRRAALVLAFTGLRKGELMGLKPHNIRGGLICLTNTKTGKPRNVPILSDIAFALKRLPFRFHPTSLSHAVRRASGEKVRVHDLRHTAASLLIQAGVPLYTVGAILGHSGPQTTKRYAHLDTRTMEEAIAKLKPVREQKKQEKAA
ncbi:MAG: tyrosine-type recombinase/integrase [Rhodospirillaceae bacterium]